MILDSQEGELWLPLEESEYCYISNYGRLYRESYTVDSCLNGRYVLRTIPGKFISGPKLSRKGYCRVTLRGKQYQVHRLVGKYFLPNHENKPQINHKDGDKTNNRADNLEWVTNQENRDHAVSTGLIALGERVSKLLTEEQVLEIRNLYKSGLQQKEIAERYGSKQQNISSIVLRKTWTHI